MVRGTAAPGRAAKADARLMTPWAIRAAQLARADERAADAHRADQRQHRRTCPHESGGAGEARARGVGRRDGPQTTTASVEAEPANQPELLADLVA